MEDKEPPHIVDTEEIQIDKEVHDQIIANYEAEMEQTRAIEIFKQTQPDMWLQFQRLQPLITAQNEMEDETWPVGSCFVHTTLPGIPVYALEQLIEIDLEACQVTMRIYEDDELAAGTVFVPLEHISWLGFPDDAVPVEIHMKGFVARNQPPKLP